MRAYIDGAWREVTAGRVRVGNAWKEIVSSRVYIGGAWKEADSFIQPLTLSASPASVVGGAVVPGTATSNATTATPSGGLAPYTYSWARVGAGSILVTSPTSATTTFRRGFTSAGTVSETFRCTVTDALGSTATADVAVQLTGIDGI